MGAWELTLVRRWWKDFKVRGIAQSLSDIATVMLIPKIKSSECNMTLTSLPCRVVPLILLLTIWIQEPSFLHTDLLRSITYKANPHSYPVRAQLFYPIHVSLLSQAAGQTVYWVPRDDCSGCFQC